MIAGIGYENAKVIKRIFRKEGRDTKICFKNKPRNFRRGDVFINPELELKKLQKNAQKDTKAKELEQADDSSKCKDVDTNNESDPQVDQISTESSKKF